MAWAGRVDLAGRNVLVGDICVLAGRKMAAVSLIDTAIETAGDHTPGFWIGRLGGILRDRRDDTAIKEIDPAMAGAMGRHARYLSLIWAVTP